MKIENEKDAQTALDLIGHIRKLTFKDFTVAEAYKVISGLEWMVAALREYHKPAAAPMAIKDNITPIKNGSKAKK